jgi:hypothetical protein
MAVGASSTGGLTALALKQLCWKSKRDQQTEENKMKIEPMEREKTGAQLIPTKSYPNFACT